MTLKSFKHFLIGAAAVVGPSVPIVVTSPAFLHFVEHHPLVAVWFPVLAGVVVELAHRLLPHKPTT